MLKELAAGVLRPLSIADRVWQLGEVCKDQGKAKVTSRRVGKRTRNYKPWEGYGATPENHLQSKKGKKVSGSSQHGFTKRSFANS